MRGRRLLFLFRVWKTSAEVNYSDDLVCVCKKKGDDGASERTSSPTFDLGDASERERA